MHEHAESSGAERIASERMQERVLEAAASQDHGTHPSLLRYINDGCRKTAVQSRRSG
jgi:hypothetical protein